MKNIFQTTFAAAVRIARIVATFTLVFTAPVLAQTASPPCASQPSVNGIQTLRCESVTIVAESGARFTLHDRDGNGRVDSIELSSKALLLDAAKKAGGNRVRVITPQAIAAVRGTRWAVDATEGKTSVFVVAGSVAVARRASPSNNRVMLGAGEGVDVGATGPLIVKRWPAERVSALMARLGQ
jgi:hypothetical protein